MKHHRIWVAGALLVMVVLLIAGCSATPGEMHETIDQAAPTLAAAAIDFVPTLEAIMEEPAPTEEAAVEEGSTESGEPAGEHEVTCDVAAVPLPTEADVTIRFTNASGNEMVVNWRDKGVSPAQLVEYARVANGDSVDLESFAEHEWVLVDHDQYTLQYVATAEPQQCVTLHHWGYVGEVGPEHWADLREEFAACSDGLAQTPISLTDATPADLENIVFNYGETPVRILNNGHTIQVDQVENNAIVLSNVTYPLRQFHFHAPSEHVEGDAHYPLEMHLVHRLDSGELAVVGVFIVAGAENGAFAPVWDHLPQKETAAIETGTRVNVANLLPAEHRFYSYSGSLTTPPCGESVKWLVLDLPIEMSAEQIAAFTAIISGNNRPLQDRHERKVMLDNTP